MEKIRLMKGLRSVPKILKINEVKGYEVSCLFNNGESRIIDFASFFKSRKNFTSTHPAYKLLEDESAFSQLELVGNTIGWQNTGKYAKSFEEEGKLIFYPYDIDPIILFEYSKLDESRTLKVGLLIKEARKEAGLTQEELARKSGTSKHYISRLENDKSDIELLTLKKIIEGGLGKTLKIQIN